MRNRSMEDDEDVARRGHGRDDAPTHLGAQAYLEYILYLSIPCRAHECHPGRSWRDSSAAAFEHEYADELLVPHHTIADARIEGGTSSGPGPPLRLSPADNVACATGSGNHSRETGACSFLAARIPSMPKICNFCCFVC